MQRAASQGKRHCGSSRKSTREGHAMSGRLDRGLEMRK